MAIDEGYIKYQLDWKKAPPFPETDIAALNEYRNLLFQKGLIGYYEDLKVGFGNVSIRWKGSRQFIISGTQTGHIPILDANHYTFVSDFDIRANTIECKGPIKASSESLTHAVIYQCNPNIQVVLHVHHGKLWERLLNVVPTSRKEVPYGTPEMADEVLRLYQDSDLSAKRILVMGGHEEGIITFGTTLEEAMEVLVRYYELIN